MSGADYEIAFVVPQRAAAQGSKVPFLTKAGRLGVREQSARVRPFRSAVRKAAREAMRLFKAIRAPKGVPVRVQAIAYYERPKRHYRARGTAVRAEAMDLPPTRHDADKIMRAIMDGLAGVAYENDSQVIDERSLKRWLPPGIDGAPECVVIRIRAGAGALLDIGWCTAGERVLARARDRDGAKAPRWNPVMALYLLKEPLE